MLLPSRVITGITKHSLCGEGSHTSFEELEFCIKEITVFQALKTGIHINVREA